MDGSLSRMRGKADFRLMRELLGLPQEWVAKRVGVDARTVRNWESPRYFYPPKREAWDLVEGLWRRADAKAAGLVEIASSAARVARRRAGAAHAGVLAGRGPVGEGTSGGRGCGHVEGRERGGAAGRGPAARHGPAGRDRVRGARGVTDAPYLMSR